jgi:hypothetical protein
MEAFMYRCHPQIARVVELIRSGAILACALTGTQFKADQAVRVPGSEGSIEIPDPWIPPAGEKETATSLKALTIALT